MNQYQSVNLPSNTIQNLKNYSQCLAITTRSSKSTIDPFMPVVDEWRNDIMDVDNALETYIKKLVTTGEASQNPLVIEK